MVAITRCLSRFCEESKLRSSTAKGHLFVITGRLTFSAAMNLASRLEHETHATFVGEPTGSRPNHYGEAVTLTLPASGITVRVSTRYWQDSKPNDKRLWIAPEMPAPPSAAVFSRGIDPAMDSILREFGHHHHSGSSDIAPQTKQTPIPCLTGPHACILGALCGNNALR